MLRSTARQVRVAEILPGEQQRFTRDSSRGIHDAIPKVQRRRMTTFAVTQKCRNRGFRMFEGKRDHFHFQFIKQFKQERAWVAAQAMGEHQGGFDHSGCGDSHGRRFTNLFE